MEKARCAYSREHIATFQCMCSQPNVLLCSECMLPHMRGPGNHMMAPVTALVPSSPSLPVEPKSSNCDTCNRQAAEDFCCCNFPVPSLCKACQMKHIQKSGSEAHYFLPIALKSKVANRKAAGQLCLFLVNLNTAKTHLQSMTGRITACQEALQERRRQLEQDLAQCVETQVQELETLKETIKAGANRGVEQAKETLLETVPPGGGLASLLWHCARAQDFRSLDLFQFESVSQKVDFMKPLGVGWRSKVDASGQVAEALTFQSRYLPTERLMSRVRRLVQLLARPSLPEGVLGQFEELLRQKLLQSVGMEDDLLQLCENLAFYVQDAKQTPLKDELLAKILAALLHSGLDDISDSNSLTYVLTRPQRLAPTLVNLQVLVDLIGPSVAQLAEVRKDHFRVFDCTSQTWGARVSLSRSVRVDDTSRCALLRSGKLFVTGGSMYVDLFYGEGKRNHFADTYDIDVAVGSARKLNNMGQKRSNHALQPYFNFVYVFGGSSDSPLHACEKYSLSAALWLPLPDMRTARHSFSPALHNHLFYLCGGDTVDCEVFDPVAESFSPLSTQLPEAGPARALVAEGQLLVLTSTGLLRRSVGEGDFQEAKHAKYSVSGSMSSVVLTAAGLFFVADDPKGTVRLVEPAAGTKLKDFWYPE